MFIINLSQHVSDIIMPIFRRTKIVLLHTVYYSVEPKSLFLDRSTASAPSDLFFG
jgi:hypothetical protein